MFIEKNSKLFTREYILGTGEKGDGVKVELFLSGHVLDYSFPDMFFNKDLDIMQRKVYEKRKKSFRKMLHISAKCFTFLGPCLLLFNSMRTVISVKLLRLAQKTLAFQYLHLPLSLPWLSYLLLHLIQ